MNLMNERELIDCSGGGFFRAAFKIISTIVTIIDVVSGIYRKWRN